MASKFKSHTYNAAVIKGYRYPRKKTENYNKHSIRFYIEYPDPKLKQGVATEHIDTTLEYLLERLNYHGIGNCIDNNCLYNVTYLYNEEKKSTFFSDIDLLTIKNVTLDKPSVCLNVEKELSDILAKEAN